MAAIISESYILLFPIVKALVDEGATNPEQAIERSVIESKYHIRGYLLDVYISKNILRVVGSRIYLDYWALRKYVIQNTCIIIGTAFLVGIIMSLLVLSTLTNSQWIIIMIFSIIIAISAILALLISKPLRYARAKNLSI